MAPVCAVVYVCGGFERGFGGWGSGVQDGDRIRLGLGRRIWMGVCELGGCFRARFVIFLIKKRMSILLKFEWS